jgi:hypothetical protein
MGYTLLPTGKILTIDVWNPPNAQQYDPGTGLWTSIASTPVSLIDPTTCGNHEIGPAVTRPDGTVVAFGGNSGCTASPRRSNRNLHSVRQHLDPGSQRTGIVRGRRDNKLYSRRCSGGDASKREHIVCSKCGLRQCGLAAYPPF